MSRCVIDMYPPTYCCVRRVLYSTTYVPTRRLVRGTNDERTPPRRSRPGLGTAGRDETTRDVRRDNNRGIGMAWRFTVRVPAAGRLARLPDCEHVYLLYSIGYLSRYISPHFHVGTYLLNLPILYRVRYLPSKQSIYPHINHPGMCLLICLVILSRVLYSVLQPPMYPRP